MHLCPSPTDGNTHFTYFQPLTEPYCNLYHSLRTSDRYAWIYSESADWWKNKIPTGSEAAMLRAKTKIQKGQSLGFNLDPTIAKAMKKCRDINKQCQST